MTDKSEVQTSVFDAWTTVHMLTGFSLGLMGVPPVLAIGASLIYEAIEYGHEYPKGSKFFGTKRPEAPRNVIGDMIAFGSTYAIGRKLRKERMR